MDITEIISDAITFPFKNVKSLLLYIVLGILLALVLTFSIFGTIAGAYADSTLAIIVALIGIIVTLIVAFAIEGFMLDVVKSGINRNINGPDIHFKDQALNGLKLLIVNIVYFIIPIIVTIVLALIFQDYPAVWIIVGIILLIIFSFAATMGQCRLAKTSDLGFALDIKGAIDDLGRIGYAKVILTIIVIAFITLIVSFILSAIFSSIDQSLGSLVAGIAELYFLFFANRATGLLYSDL